MPPEYRNLVISPIGDDSLHESWLSDRGARTFDLFLIHYGKQPDFGRCDANHYVSRRGFKWELLDHVASEQREVLERYDQIWCPDADIRSDTESINRMFAIFQEHRLELAQPAIERGEISYQFLRRRSELVLRYSPFVEVMCPLFSRQAFFKVAPTFLESRSGWGLDLIWPRFFEANQMAVIDAVGVEHAGQLFRGENYQNLARIGIDPGSDMRRIIAKHGDFNRRLHRKLVRGRVKLPAIWKTPRSESRFQRLLASFGLRASRA